MSAGSSASISGIGSANTDELVAALVSSGVDQLLDSAASGDAPALPGAPRQNAGSGPSESVTPVIAAINIIG